MPRDLEQYEAQARQLAYFGAASLLDEVVFPVGFNHQPAADYLRSERNRLERLWGSGFVSTRIVPTRDYTLAAAALREAEADFAVSAAVLDAAIQIDALEKARRGDL